MFVYFILAADAVIEQTHELTKFKVNAHIFSTIKRHDVFSSFSPIFLHSFDDVEAEQLHFPPDFPLDFDDCMLTTNFISSMLVRDT